MSNDYKNLSDQLLERWNPLGLILDPTFTPDLLLYWTCALLTHLGTGYPQSRHYTTKQHRCMLFGTVSLNLHAMYIYPLPFINVNGYNRLLARINDGATLESPLNLPHLQDILKKIQFRLKYGTETLCFTDVCFYPTISLIFMVLRTT